MSESNVYQLQFETTKPSELRGSAIAFLAAVNEVMCKKGHVGLNREQVRIITDSVLTALPKWWTGDQEYPVELPPGLTPEQRSHIANALMYVQQQTRQNMLIKVLHERVIFEIKILTGIQI